MFRRIVRLLVVFAAIAASALALSVHTAAADPFYCDGAGPSISSTTDCGQTGVCYWEYLGNGLWMVVCRYYCEVYYCG